MIELILSGGQTGVDRAALDAAIQMGIAYGGWCPQGRIDEQGIIPERYNSLKEISGNFNNEKENYDTRTKCNIRDSDATLILVPKIPLPREIKDGTLLTIEEVQKQNKSYLMIDLARALQSNVEDIIKWINQNNIIILNIAGPRESNSPGIYKLSLKLLEKTLFDLKNKLSINANL